MSGGRHQAELGQLAWAMSAQRKEGVSLEFTCQAECPQGSYRGHIFLICTKVPYGLGGACSVYVRLPRPTPPAP